MTHEMKLNDTPFRLVETGEKRVELRLQDEKRQKIRAGDAILFRHADDLSRTVTRYVVRLHAYPTFAALFTALPMARVGFGSDDPQACAAEMRGYYSEAEETSYGALGIELCEDENVRAHMTEAEAWEYTARKVFEKYDEAFRQLAKGPDWD